MQLKRYDPYYRSARPLSALGRLLQETDFDTLLGNTLDAASGSDIVTDWLPAVDIQEQPDSFLLKADLPGVDPENIEVTMEDGILTIQGNRESEKHDESDNFSRYERVKGRFLRRFTLPDTANGEAIEATTRHGVLEVTIPKQARLQPRKIAVKNG